MQPTATDPRQQLADFAHYLREHGFALGFAEINLMLRAASALPLAQWKRTEALWRAIASGSQPASGGADCLLPWLPDRAKNDMDMTQSKINGWHRGIHSRGGCGQVPHTTGFARRSGTHAGNGAAAAAALC